MKIKISDVDRMIKEEFQKMMEKKKLSSRLSQINEELGKMNAEDSILNEVEASGMQKTKSATGLVPGNQHGVKFEKIGTHLKEDESGEEEMGLEVGGDDMGADMVADMGSDETPMGEFEAKFAEIGRAIDAKMTGEASEEAPEMGAEEGDSDEDFEEVEVTDDNEEGEEEVEEVDEYAEVSGGVGAEQGMTAGQALEKPVKESVEEPLEGESVAQMTSADDVNDNMEKDTHVKESAKKKGAVINEAKKTEAKNIFTEGLDVKKKTALLEEMNRMKKFAGLSKDEE